jgi:hypothetical protein
VRRTLRILNNLSGDVFLFDPARQAQLIRTQFELLKVFICLPASFAGRADLALHKELDYILGDNAIESDLAQRSVIVRTIKMRKETVDEL